MAKSTNVKNDLKALDKVVADLSKQFKDFVKSQEKVNKSLSGTSSKVKKQNSEVKENIKTAQEFTIVLGRQAEAYMSLDTELIKNKDLRRSNILELKKEGLERKKTLLDLKQDIIQRSKEQLKLKEGTAERQRASRATIAELRARNLNNRAIKREEAARKRVLSELKKSIIERNKESKVIEKTTSRTRLLNNSFATIRSKMLLFNFAMGLGARQLAGFSKEAAKLTSVTNAFNTLAGATEDSTTAISNLRAATDGTMSSFDLFQQANNAMILGVSSNSEEMAEMFDIAQRLGRALGRDTASSVESLITGIGRQSRLMLDNIGIIVKSGDAYEKYAKKLGTTAEKLTEAERKQAFFEAAMGAARTAVAKLGAEQLTAQDRFDRFGATLDNFQKNIGQFVTPVVLGFLERTATFMQRIMESDLETAVRQMKELGVSVEKITKLQTLVNLEDAVINVEKNTKKINKILTDQVSLSDDSLNQLGIQFSRGTEKHDPFRFAQPIIDASALSIDVMNELTDALIAEAEGLDLSTKAARDANKTRLRQITDEVSALQTLIHWTSEVNQLRGKSPNLDQGTPFPLQAPDENAFLTTNIIEVQESFNQESEKLLNDFFIKRHTAQLNAYAIEESALIVAAQNTIDNEQELQATITSIQDHFRDLRGKKDKEEQQKLKEAQDQAVEAIEARIHALQRLQDAEAGEDQPELLEGFDSQAIEDLISLKGEDIVITDELISLLKQETEERAKLQEIQDANALALEKEENLKSILVNTDASRIKDLEATKDKLLELRGIEKDKEFFQNPADIKPLTIELGGVVFNEEQIEGALRKIQEQLDTFKPPELVISTDFQEGFAEFEQGFGMLKDVGDAFFKSSEEGFRREFEDLKNSDKFKRMSTREQEKALNTLELQQKSAREKAFKNHQNLTLAGIAMDTAGAIMKIWKDVPKGDAGIATFILTGLAAAQGVAQASIVKGQKMKSFEQGGLVGGRRHSQGGTIIEAEKGEFVMSRSAVQANGIETMNRINQGSNFGASANVTVNVSGNVMSQDYVEDILAEQIRDAVRRGTDFGVN